MFPAYDLVSVLCDRSGKYGGKLESKSKSKSKSKKSSELS